MLKKLLLLLIIILCNVKLYSFDIIDKFPDAAVITLPVIAIIDTTEITENAASEVAYSVGFSLLVNTSLGALVHSYYDEWDVSPSGSDFSFASNYAGVVFATATYIHIKKNSIYYDLGYYGIAATTGFARYYKEHSNIRDVVVGGAVGVLSAYLFTEANSRLLRYYGFSVMPNISRNQYGFSIYKRV